MSYFISCFLPFLWPIDEYLELQKASKLEHGSVPKLTREADVALLAISVTRFRYPVGQSFPSAFCLLSKLSFVANIQTKAVLQVRNPAKTKDVSSLFCGQHCISFRPLRMPRTCHVAHKHTCVSFICSPGTYTRVKRMGELYSVFLPAGDWQKDYCDCRLWQFWRWRWR